MQVTLPIHPLYDFLKYRMPGCQEFHTGWMIDLAETNIAVVDYDIHTYTDDVYAKILKDYQAVCEATEDRPTFLFYPTADATEDSAIVIYPEEMRLIKDLVGISDKNKRRLIRQWIMDMEFSRYGHNDYIVKTCSGGLHFYYVYDNKMYEQRNIKCIRKIFYEVDILMNGPMHSFVTAPNTVAFKNGKFGRYCSPCKNVNMQFPCPFEYVNDEKENISSDSYSSFEDIPEDIQLKNYVHAHYIENELVMGHKRFRRGIAKDIMILTLPMSPLPEQFLDYCTEKTPIKLSELQLMRSRPEKTPNLVRRSNCMKFKKFVDYMIRYGQKIHLTAHRGKNYTNEFTVLHLLGAISVFNDDMRGDFIRILKENPACLTPNAQKQLTRPHKGVKEYGKNALNKFVNYYTNADVEFFVG